MNTERNATAPRDRKFVIGCDHGGYELKERVKGYLLQQGNAVDDRVEESMERIDFPPVAEEVGQAVAGQPDTYGVLICGTGLGMSMAANKVRGVRAALLYDEFSAEYARRHNDANVLVFGGRTMDFDQVRRRIEVFFGQEFEGGKYAERNDYIGGIEGLGEQ
jgi:ribose 5-phosphate isomerase B